MKEYCLGFRFGAYHDGTPGVLLILKKRPKWQLNLFNGIGGQVNNSEHPMDAMVREFKEETGLVTARKDWSFPLMFKAFDDEWRVYVFTSQGDILNARNMTDELPTPVRLMDIPAWQVVPNLRWMIPLVLDSEIAQPLEITFNPKHSAKQEIIQ